jgi:hypothetical protein
MSHIAAEQIRRAEQAKENAVLLYDKCQPKKQTGRKQTAVSAVIGQPINKQNAGQGGQNYKMLRVG